MKANRSLIKKEFQDLVFITKKEYEELVEVCKEKSLNGLKIQVFIWKEKDIIISGFNEYEIAKQYELPIEVVKLSFKNKYEAKQWVVLCEFGGKSYYEPYHHYLIGKLYNELKQDKNANLKQNKPKDQNELSKNVVNFTTAEIIAKKFKNSASSVKRYGTFAKYVDKLAGIHGRELKNDLLTKEIILNNIELAKLSNFEESKQKRIVNKLREGTTSLKLASATVDNEDRGNSSTMKIVSNKFKPNSLYYGEAQIILNGFPENSIDCVVMDPPYGISVGIDKKRFPNFNDKEGHALEVLDKTLIEIKKVLKEDGHMYIFSSGAKLPEFYSVIKKHFDYVSPTPIIWYKGRNGLSEDFLKHYAPCYEAIWFISNGKRKLNFNVSPDVLNYSIVANFNRVHYCQKPVDLLSYLILNSTQKDEIVLDCFSGSSSSLVAARLAGRQFIGIEKDEKIYRLGLDEINNYEKYSDRFDKAYAKLNFGDHAINARMAA